jgi:hypothetical protein
MHEWCRTSGAVASEYSTSVVLQTVLAASTNCPCSKYRFVVATSTSYTTQKHPEARTACYCTEYTTQKHPEARTACWDYSKTSRGADCLLLLHSKTSRGADCLLLLLCTEYMYTPLKNIPRRGLL